MNYVVLGICLILLAITIYLEIKGRLTLSQRYQKIFPTWFDICLFVAGEIGLCVWKHCCPELHIGLLVFMAGFWGHVTFPNKERYGD